MKFKSFIRPLQSVFKLKSTIQENQQRKVRELKRQPLIHLYNSIRQCSEKNDQKDLYQIQTIINQKEEIISLNNLNLYLQKYKDKRHNPKHLSD